MAWLPPTTARMVGRRASVLLGVPVDWATAVAINPGAAGTICARNNNVARLAGCVPRVNTFQLNRWLMIGARFGHVVVVQYLCELPLDRGVDPAALDNYSVRTASSRGYLNVVQFLCELPLDRGVDPGANENDAVGCAASCGHLDVVRYLCELPLDRGVNPGAVNSFALQWAAFCGHLDMVEYLCGLPLDRGIDPAADDNEVLRIAKHHKEIVRFLEGVLVGRGSTAIHSAMQSEAT